MRDIYSFIANRTKRNILKNEGKLTPACLGVNLPKHKFRPKMYGRKHTRRHCASDDRVVQGT